MPISTFDVYCSWCRKLIGQVDGIYDGSYITSDNHACCTDPDCIRQEDEMIEKFKKDNK